MSILNTARKHSIKRFGIIALVLLNIGCDQISKGMVRQYIAPMEYIEVIPNNLILTNVENTGAMLGFGQDFPPMVKLVMFQIVPTIVLFILLLRVFKKSYLNTGLALAFSFVIGGGIGNLMDRIAYGSVTDFFQLKLGVFKTGIFNMADVSVSIGVFFLIMMAFAPKRRTI